MSRRLVISFDEKPNEYEADVKLVAATLKNGEVVAFDFDAQGTKMNITIVPQHSLSLGAFSGQDCLVSIIGWKCYPFWLLEQGVIFDVGYVMDKLGIPTEADTKNLIRLFNDIKKHGRVVRG